MRETLSRYELQLAAADGALLLEGLFGHQHGKRLQARRLILTRPPAPTRVGCKRAFPSEPEIMRVRYNASASAPRERTELGFESVGACFGVSLGCLIAYLSDKPDTSAAAAAALAPPGAPGLDVEVCDPRGETYAGLLRRLRATWAPMATALATMRGDDVPHLCAGLASCRVAIPQRSGMPGGGGVAINAQYGCKWTAVGTIAAILGAFGVMSKFPNHARHLVADNSLTKALRCAEEALNYWRPSNVSMPGAHWAAVEAERRALRRAAVGTMRATQCARERALDPTPTIAMQLEWALRAAFPANECVDEQTQTALILKISKGAVYLEKPVPGSVACVAKAAADGADELAVPLSDIPAGALIEPRSVEGGDGTDSDTGSWVRVGSSRSSGSRESADSLSSLGLGSALNVTN